MRISRWAAATLMAVAGAGAGAMFGADEAAGAQSGEPPFAAERPNKDPFPSTYRAAPSGPVLIRGATIIDGEGGERANADLLIQDGRVAAIGENLAAPAGAAAIDGRGKFVTPGIIDAHSHLGVYPSPGLPATANGNEATSPNRAEVWAEHSIWPMDPGFERAVAGGVTAMHILPGSANLFGGRGVTVRPALSARTMQEMKFPGAPYSLKMACGENPARVYGGRNSAPSTAMANVAGYRAAFIEAKKYDREWKEYWRKAAPFEEAAQEGQRRARRNKPDGSPPDPPDRDLALETLAGVLNGEILVQWHCYRSDEMVVALDIAREFGFRVSAFHHAVEAYKIADVLARERVCGALWADWWGFKIEAYDAIRENIPFMHAAGACAIVHSDDAVGIQRLNQEAAKALSDGRRAGLDISRADAWRWLSLNPATALGIADRTGSLAPGKAADVVVWSADPFSTYAVAERVFIDGAQVYQRGAPRAPSSDFELGQVQREPAR